MKQINLSSFAYDQLLQGIIAFEIVPGTTLQERNMAESLEISRTPVREALARLAHEGWLTSFSRRNIEVRRITEVDIDELFALRELFELKGIDRIFEQKTTAEMARHLQKRVDAMSLLSLDDFEYIVTDLSFHTDLMSFAPHSRISKFWDQISLELFRMGVIALKSRGTERSSVQDEHDAILQGFIQKKKKDSKKAVSNHIAVTKSHLLRCLTEIRKNF